jgi:hypothetical protein
MHYKLDAEKNQGGQSIASAAAAAAAACTGTSCALTSCFTTLQGGI